MCVCVGVCGFVVGVGACGCVCVLCASVCVCVCVVRACVLWRLIDMLSKSIWQMRKKGWAFICEAIKAIIKHNNWAADVIEKDLRRVMGKCNCGFFCHSDFQTFGNFEEKKPTQNCQMLWMPKRRGVVQLLLSVWSPKPVQWSRFCWIAPAHQTAVDRIK